MKTITCCGPPSVGKTSVLLKTIVSLQAAGIRVGVAKFDCLATNDDVRYRALAVPVRKALSGPLCPDHFFVSNLDEVLQWAEAEQLDWLITESAGLCNRCSPYLKGVLAVCVIDHLSGIHAPLKIGPMLKLADLVVLTKGDIVSQAEREVFRLQVTRVNPSAAILNVSGLTGQGRPNWPTCFAIGSATISTCPMPRCVLRCLRRCVRIVSGKRGSVRIIRLAMSENCNVDEMMLHQGNPNGSAGASRPDATLQSLSVAALVAQRPLIAPFLEDRGIPANTQATLAEWVARTTNGPTRMNNSTTASCTARWSNSWNGWRRCCSPDRCGSRN